MKVKDLIEKLKSFDPELPITLADWSEDWAKDDESVAANVA